MNNNNYDANGYPVYPRAGRVLDYEDNKMYNKFVGPDTFAPTSDAIYRLPMSTPHLDKHAAVHGEYLNHHQNSFDSLYFFRGCQPRKVCSKQSQVSRS